MGNRGFNAGGWAYMPRVWCPKCGWSFLIGNETFNRYCDRDSKRPMLCCNNQKKCAERERRKRARK